MVVVRCADWADPCGSARREVLRAVLDLDAVARLAPADPARRRRGRGDFAVGLLDEVLRRCDGERSRRCSPTADRIVRRYAYRLAVDEGHLSPAELARAAARDADPVVQSLCAEAALAAVRGGRTADGRGVLDHCSRAQAPGAVRRGDRVAAGRAGRAGGRVPRRPVRAGAGLCAVCRTAGREAIRWPGIGGGVPGRRPALSAGAVTGLAECGERADAELLWPLLGHPRPGVRARAVAGLRTLDVADVRRLRALLDDPEPGVVREVTLALLPFARTLDDRAAGGTAGGGSPRQARVAAFRLLDAHGGLARLRAAVALLDDPDDRLRHRAAQSVRGWLRRRRCRAGRRRWRTARPGAALLDESASTRTEVGGRHQG